jgi:hypothetical protein
LIKLDSLSFKLLFDISFIIFGQDLAKILSFKVDGYDFCLKNYFMRVNRVFSGFSPKLKTLPNFV